MPSVSQLSTTYEKEGCRATRDGLFLRQYGGGGKLSQIYVRTNKCSPILSDCLLQHGRSVMTLLLLDPSNHDEVEEAESILERSRVPGSMLSQQSIVLLCSAAQSSTTTNMKSWKLYQPCLESEIVGLESLPGYSVRRYFGRFTRGAKYVITRPDLIIFAVAKSSVELEKCFELLQEKL
jgi:hypothetical protein